jgi:hypothetical protein
MESDALFIEIIADGPEGYPKDGIIQIGIAAADFESGEAESVLFETVSSKRSEWTERHTEYVGTKIGDTDLAAGFPLEDVVRDVKRVLADKVVSSFDISNTFGGYLIFNPWDLTHETSVMPSVCSRIPGGEHGFPADENERITKAYDRMFPDDDHGLSGGKNALDYALMTAYMAIELRSHGLY